MIESQLKEALISMQEAISKSDSEQILKRLSEIDALRLEGRKTLDPQLKHYLKNRSYEKAILFLEGACEIPKGRCGGRKDFS